MKIGASLTLLRGDCVGSSQLDKTLCGKPHAIPTQSIYHFFVPTQYPRNPHTSWCIFGIPTHFDISCFNVNVLMGFNGLNSNSNWNLPTQTRSQYTFPTQTPFVTEPSPHNPHAIPTQMSPFVSPHAKWSWGGPSLRLCGPRVGLWDSGFNK